VKPSRLLALAAAVAAAIVAAPLRSADPPPIVSEKDAGQSWSPAPGVARVVAGYPTTVADRSQDVCVNIGFFINQDGSTSDFSEMNAWHGRHPDEKPKSEWVRPFAQSAAAAVSLWRFVPVSEKSQPIYTSATFAFDGSKALALEQILGRCRIDDLREHVSQARREAELRGNLARAQMERARAQKGERRKGIQKTSRSESDFY
jgi:hypothetical protein